MTEQISKKLARRVAVWEVEKARLQAVIDAAVLTKKSGDRGKLFEAAGISKDQEGEIPTPKGKYIRQQETMANLDFNLRLFGPMVKRS